MTRVVLRPQALRDLEDITDYISRNNASRALSFVDELQQTCASLAEFPKRGTPRDDLMTGVR